MADDRPETWEVWLYSILATGVLCIVSLSGALLLLRGMHKHFRAWMRELMALSAGTLIGATLFSMFPETVEQLGFGLDVTCTILGGIAFGFLAENVAHAHGDHKRRKKSVYCEEVEEVILSPRAERRTVQPHTHGHGHNATVLSSPRAEMDTMHKLGNFEREEAAMVIFHAQPQQDLQARRASEPAVPSASKQQVQERSQGNKTAKQAAAPGLVVLHEDDHHHHHHHHHEEEEEDPRGYLAVISLLGDGLHNLVDGALIGAAFQSGVGQGVIITLAIAIHELPQEMADFAVLLHAGLTVNQALLTNFLVSLTSILGACIAISIGDDSVTPYFVPFAGGMFLYLALTCLLPEVMHSGHSDEPHAHGIDWSHADAYIAATRNSSPAPSSLPSPSPRLSQSQSQGQGQFPPTLRVNTEAEPVAVPASASAPGTGAARGASKPHTHHQPLPLWVRIRAVLFLGVGLGIMGLLLLIPHTHAHGGDEDHSHGEDDHGH